MRNFLEGGSTPKTQFDVNVNPQNFPVAYKSRIYMLRIYKKAPYFLKLYAIGVNKVE